MKIQTTMMWDFRSAISFPETDAYL